MSFPQWVFPPIAFPGIHSLSSFRDQGTVIYRGGDTAVAWGAVLLPRPRGSGRLLFPHACPWLSPPVIFWKRPFLCHPVR